VAAKHPRATRHSGKGEPHRLHGLSKTTEAKMFYAARVRANKQHVPFDIVIEDIHIPDLCPILGIQLFVSSTDAPCANSPTIDRLVPELGYVVGNINVISHRANRLKNSATPQELRLIADWMENNGYNE
jgi:hypothetical protein